MPDRDQVTRARQQAQERTVRVVDGELRVALVELPPREVRALRPRRRAATGQGAGAGRVREREVVSIDGRPWRRQ